MTELRTTGLRTTGLCTTGLRQLAARLWEANAEAWSRHVRAGYDIYRDALHTPAFLAMLPDVAGLHGLDVGCGEGGNTRMLAARGAAMTGIDIAPAFIRAAAALPGGIAYLVGDGMELPFADDSFDFATAFMSLMDMPEPGLALAGIRRVLRPGGFLQFSILHPCFVPRHRKVLREGGQPYAVELGGYFQPVPGEIERWWFSTLPQAQRDQDPPFQIARFHHTLGQWVGAVVGAGLTIEAMEEPSAAPELAATQPVVADTRIVPVALLVCARKPG